MREHYMNNSLAEDSVILAELGQDRERYYNAAIPPVFFSSLHTFSSYEDYLSFSREDKKSYMYGRVSNPGVALLEDMAAKLERGEKALAFSSGMAASISAVNACTGPNSHIVTMKSIYKPLRMYLDSLLKGPSGISVSYVDGVSADQIMGAVRPETDLIILESPSSNIFSIVPIEEVAAFAKDRGIKTMIDNSFCTPVFQKPLLLGIDIVMHTASKYLSGHSDLIAGILVSRDKELIDRIAFSEREIKGSILGPMEAFLLLRGMRTLIVRLNEHQRNALAICEYLQSCSFISKVFYPGLSGHPGSEMVRRQQLGSTGLLSFVSDLSPEDAIRFADALSLFHIGISWGGFESLITLPHYKLSPQEVMSQGAGRNLIRLHVGLQSPDCLIEDLDQAFSLVLSKKS